MGGLIESLGALIAIIVAILPGVPGETAHSMMNGKSWLEKDWEYVIRVLFFSIIGLLAYSIVVNRYDWPAPSHIFLSTFDKNGLNAEKLSELGVGYFGHLAASTIMGIATGAGHLVIRKCVPGLSGRHRDTWDEFVRAYIKKRWVVVTLRDGTRYAGMIEQADISREPEYRDIVLNEPALWDPDKDNYIASSEYYLYLTGDQITSLSAVTDSEKDKRKTIIGEPIFPKEETNEKRQA